MISELWRRWSNYKYRFIPWLALNLKNRVIRHVPRDRNDDVIEERDATFVLCQILQLLHEHHIPGATAEESYRRNCELVAEALGYCVERRSSQVRGQGVFARKDIPPYSLVAMYPGTVYLPGDPVLLQSLGNQFIFRCLDGLLIDGNDRGISRCIFRSCVNRDRVGLFVGGDTTWLYEWPHNPLAVGQYVNNQIEEHSSNVAYQEVPLPPDLPPHLRACLPYASYQPSRAHRAVVLVSTRRIPAGHELFSSYFTVVHR